MAHLTMLWLIASPCAEPPQSLPFAVLEEVMITYAEAEKNIAAGADGVILLREGAKKYPNIAAFHRALGIAYGIRGMWPSAYTAYVRYLGFADVAESDRREVTAELARLAAKHVAVAYYEKGMRTIGDGQAMAGLEWLLLAIESKPDFALARQAAAAVYRNNGDAPRAIAEYRELLKSDPLAPDRAMMQQFVREHEGTPSERVDRALLLLRSAQEEQALAELEDLAEEAPQFADVYRALGEVRRAMKQRSLALEAFRKFTTMTKDEQKKQDVLRTIQEMESEKRR